MAKVVTGMSGAGKSACLEVLRSVDITPWTPIPTNGASGRRTPMGPRTGRGEDAISSLLERELTNSSSPAARRIQGKFYPSSITWFSFRAGRHHPRTSEHSVHQPNTDTATPSDGRSFDHLADVEPRLRATATMEIDASAPLSEVVAQLEHFHSRIPRQMRMTRCEEVVAYELLSLDGVAEDVPDGFITEWDGRWTGTSVASSPPGHGDTRTSNVRRLRAAFAAQRK